MINENITHMDISKLNKNEIAELEAKLQERKDKLNRQSERFKLAKTLDPNEVYLFKVTTKGDCEGRSIETIGYFRGTYANVIRYIIKKQYSYIYNFTLTVVKEEPVIEVKHEDVEDVFGWAHISFPLEQCDSIMKAENRAYCFEKWLDDPDVEVAPGRYYNGAAIHFNPKQVL